MKPTKALAFDVFGTLVDWRTSIAREVRETLGARGMKVDAEAFADAWRGEYQPAMEEIRSGRKPFCRLDELHRRNLDRVLKVLELDAVDEATRDHLNQAWHRLDPWPDVNAALARLRHRYLVAPCSNGNIALMIDLARHNRWHWDAILGAEFARDYKPKPVVYTSTAAAFGCDPEQVVMVAAHSSDLAAAAAAGLRTAFVARPDEHGAARGEKAPSVEVDFTALGLGDLADRLGHGDA